MNNPTVLDFVVFHDSVFFCGRCGQNAMYGYFDIYDAFFGIGFVSCFNLPPSIPTPFLNKIDVTTTSAGETHMLMTGMNFSYGSKYSGFYKDSSDIFGENRVYIQPGVILEAWRNTPISNEIRYTIDSNCNYYYDDVVFTDRFAVITAHTTETPTTTHNVFYYGSPSSTSSFFLEYWTSPAPSISNTPIMSALPPICSEKILITKMQRDSFATVCHNYQNGNVVVSIYQDPTQQSIKRFEIPGVIADNDFVFSVLRNLFYIKTTSYPFDLCYSKYPFTTSTKIMDNDYVSHRWLSLDITDNAKHVILSGLEGISFSIAPKHFWLFDDKDIGSCFYPDDVTNNEMDKTDIPRFYLQKIESNTVDVIKIPVIRSTYILKIECQ